MFELHGIIKNGTTIVGSVEKDGVPKLVAVALAEGLKPAEITALKQDIQVQMVHPDRYVHVTDRDRLMAQFANQSAQTITANIDSPDHAVASVEPVLLSGAGRAIFICADRQSYMTTCTELAMSRQQFYAFDELRVLLDDQQEQRETVVGTAHKLVEALAAGDLKMLDGSTMSGVHREEWVEHLTAAQKFHLGDTALSLPSEKLESFDDLLYPGDYRLPFGRCLFEYNMDIKGETDIFYLYAVQVNDTFQYRGFVFFYDREQGAFTYTCGGPKWSINEDHTPHYEGSSLILPSDHRHSVAELDRIQETSGAVALTSLHLIGPHLAAMNEPQSTITLGSAPAALQKKRREKDRIPFFKYHEVSIHRPEQDGVAVRGNAVMGREGTALHKVRGHEREVRPGEKKWVFPYDRGDPAFGVVHKGYRREDGGENTAQPS